jgi:hypothetical protein
MNIKSSVACVWYAKSHFTEQTVIVGDSLYVGSRIADATRRHYALYSLSIIWSDICYAQLSSGAWLVPSISQRSSVNVNPLEEWIVNVCRQRFANRHARHRLFVALEQEISQHTTDKDAASMESHLKFINLTIVESNN